MRHIKDALRLDFRLWEEPRNYNVPHPQWRYDFIMGNLEVHLHQTDLATNVPMDAMGYIVKGCLSAFIAATDNKASHIRWIDSVHTLYITPQRPNKRLCLTLKGWRAPDFQDRIVELEEFGRESLKMATKWKKYLEKECTSEIEHPVYGEAYRDLLKLMQETKQLLASL